MEATGFIILWWVFLPYIDMNQPLVYIWLPSRNPLPPPSPSHPSGSSQCTSPQHPVSWIKPGLAIYFTYDNIHVSSYSLKSSHPHLLPQSAKVCSLYVSLLLFHIESRCYYISKFHIYIYVNILYWCFSFWLTSLCIIDSSFIYLIRTDANVFFLIAE